MAGNRRWTQDETAVVRRMVAEGESHKRIARRLGRTRCAVADHCRRLGLRRWPARASQITLLRQLHAQGLNDYQAAARLGWTQTRVRRLRRGLGLPAKGRWPKRDCA